MRIWLAAAIILLLLGQGAFAEESGSTEGADPDPDDSGSSSCNCPDAKTIANAVVDLLEDKQKTKKDDLGSKYAIDFDAAESAAKNDSYLDQFMDIVAPEHEIGCGVTFEDLEEVKEDKNMAKRTGLDTPLEKGIEKIPAGGLIRGLLNLVGIDPKVIPVRDSPKILYCSVASLTTLWEYPHSLYGCLHDVTIKRLAEDQPRRVEEYGELKEWEHQAQIGCDASESLFNELTRSNAGNFNIMGGEEE
ncbi:MAG: hypothetical protein ABIG20_01690 [archaeon]